MSGSRPYSSPVLVIMRFRGAGGADQDLGDRLEAALAVLGRQRGFLEGHVGRNVDDPALWVLESRWKGAGAYRRALSAYDVKMEAWATLGEALDEPTAYEVLTPGHRLNEAHPRAT